MVFGLDNSKFRCPCLPGVSPSPFSTSTLSNLHRALVCIPNIGPILRFPRAIIMRVLGTFFNVCRAQILALRSAILAKLWINFLPSTLDCGAFDPRNFLNLSPAKVIVDSQVSVYAIVLIFGGMARSSLTIKVMLCFITEIGLFYSPFYFRVVSADVS